MTIRETLTDFCGRLIAQKPMSDAELLRRSEWCEVTGEPMNAYAEEYSRRHDGDTK